MPLGYPDAVVGGGDAANGAGFFGLNTAQQAALLTFWGAPGEFLVRVTHVAFGAWLAPAGIRFLDPTAASHSCAASHVLEVLLIGAWILEPAIADADGDQFGRIFESECPSLV